MLLMAQVCGLPLGFGCLCGGDLRMVSEAMCQDDVCHVDTGRHEEHSHHGVPCDETDHEHEHLMVTADFLAMAAHQTAALPAPLVTHLPVFENHLAGAPPTAWPVARRDRQRCPAPGERLARRGMVLLV